MGMSAGLLERLIQFRRYTTERNPLNELIKVWHDHGPPVWAHRQDVSDGEQLAAAAVSSFITTRFTVRSSEFTRDITPKDEIQHDGRIYNITGIKEATHGRFRFLEITCSARAE